MEDGLQHVFRKRSVFATALLLTVVVVVGGSVVWFERATRDEGHSSELFCAALTQPARAVRLVRAAVTGEPEKSTLTLEALRSTAGVVYADRVAEGAPADDRSDAHIVVRALRSAVRAGSVGPLDRPATQRAVARLQAHARELCPPR
jgi:hypothetical protein